MWLSFLFACTNNTSDPVVIDNQQTNPISEKQTIANPSSTDAPSPQMGSKKDQPITSKKSFYEGETVTLTGRVTYEGKTEGAIQIEVLMNATAPSTPPEMIHRKNLEKLGDFSIEVPVSTKDISLMAYIDQNGDGIDSNDNDPRGMYTFTSKKEKIENVEIKILDTENWKKWKEEQKSRK